ncbi:MAG: STM4014 family protein [Pirellulales bacterium]|nr:STM4014 family protein [Pirellulales bacterium]
MTIIGIPETRRIQSIQAAATRMGYVQVQVLSYLELFADASRLQLCEGWIRLEPPNECWATTRLILQAGIAACQAGNRPYLSLAALETLTYIKGQMLAPWQWYHGFCHWLHIFAAETPHLQWLNHPHHIMIAFDKLQTLISWDKMSLPTPPRYPVIRGYDELRSLIKVRHARLFLKLRYGYTALGAVALEWHNEKIRALTTMETVETGGQKRLFLNKRVQRLRDESQIAWLVDRLAQEELLVEEWLPKARYQGKNFDLRVVVFQGRPQHVVGRATAGPFTNLNLDGVRLSREDVQASLAMIWGQIEALAGRAADQFPLCKMLGLDILIHADCQRCFLLEANACGDYLPGLLHKGETTHEMEMRELLATHGSHN